MCGENDLLKTLNGGSANGGEREKEPIDASRFIQKQQQQERLGPNPSRASEVYRGKSKNTSSTRENMQILRVLCLHPTYSILQCITMTEAPVVPAFTPNHLLVNLHSEINPAPMQFTFGAVISST